MTYLSACTRVSYSIILSTNWYNIMVSLIMEFMQALVPVMVIFSPLVMSGRVFCFDFLCLYQSITSYFFAVFGEDWYVEFMQKIVPIILFTSDLRSSVLL